MAYDDRDRGRERDEWRERGREEFGQRPANRAWVRDEDPESMRGQEREVGEREERGEGRPTRWRGDPDAFGGGFGNQRPRVRRLGSRNDRGEPDYERRDEEGEERYRPGVQEGYGRYTDEYSESFGTGGARGYAGPGYDSEFGGPRFDRADAGSTGTHGVHPVGSASGSAYGGGFGAGTGSYRSSARQYRMAHRDEEHGGKEHDPHYSEWRRRQIDQLDRDYDEFRREHQSRFHEEFGAWRERRSVQRQELGKVSEHMEVTGREGEHVGTVDCVKGDRIVLTKSDPDAGGRHHSIPCGWIEAVDEKVRLNKTADEAQREWRDEDRSRALFEPEDSGSGGPHVLDRSFSGTYR